MTRGPASCARLVAGLAVSALLLFLSSAPAQLILRKDQKPLPIDGTVRDKVIGDLLKELDDNYVFPEVAKKMRLAIEKRVKGKEYDSIATGQELAKRLTQDLQEVSKDKHLRVNCSTEPLPKPRPKKEKPSEKDRQQWREQMRFRNSGFSRLERLAGNVGYLEMIGFMDVDEGADTVTAAMNFLANTDALIIDLRRNGGGSPKMVQLVCSYFFDGKPIHLNSLYWRKGDRTEEFWTLEKVPGKRYLGKPLYILTSARTFSAAEEFTYNLKNLKRATVVGETTGGGAHPGGGARLGDHFFAFIPTGRAINPITKTNWEGTGVAPDVAVKADEALDTAHRLALKQVVESVKDKGARQRLERRIKMDLEMEKRTKKP
jgi:hypothetical protein